MAPSTTPLPRDPSSYSNPWAIKITHSDFEFDIDFEQRVLHCWCEHRASIIEAGCTELLLDTRALHILEVTVDGIAVVPSTGDSSEALGSALSVPLPSGKQPGDTVRVEMRWDTSPDAVAVQWLAPEQTVGGKFPYLFTQCQAIHARSLYPCQDTPGAKMTYTAAVRVPAALTALMSALPVDNEETEGEGNPGKGGGGGATKLTDLQHVPSLTSSSSAAADIAATTKIFRFNQPLPISTYLMALAVGELASRDLSTVSRVWSEPSVVDAAALEFEDTPRFLEAIQKLAGPYRWGRYDMLLLPGSFPYGGMENPNMTFVTPTLLAGDKSLANVISHELAHSYTGNLVTNRDWSGFFLNEGPTVWLERRILGLLEGEQTFQFRASLGWGTLVKSVAQWGPDHPYTRLVPDLSAGVDPDDAFSSIPYEKGFALFYYLETLVGGPEVFVPFFKEYIEKFADELITPEAFRDIFMNYFLERGVEAVKQVDWDTWYFKTGMPPITNTYDETLAQQAYDLAKKWHTSDVMGLGCDGPKGGASASDIEGWSSAQLVAFLEKLGELRSMTPLHPMTARALAGAYPLFETSKNSEVRCAWYLLCLKAGDETVLPAVTEFLGEQGRMKFVRPLYRALNASPKFKDVALTTFALYRGKYHPIAAKMCAVDLGLQAREG